MVQLKLTLKSNRPSVVYSTNGKSYKLQPGSNTLNLEYEDYVALATALSIKPVVNKPEPLPQPTEETPKQEPEKVEESSNLTNESEIKSQDDASSDDKETDSNVENNEEPALDDDNTAESDDTPSESNEDTSVVDYSQLSYAELKAKYKEITGKSCKLKKDELISFLQEHSDNAE